MWQNPTACPGTERTSRCTTGGRAQRSGGGLCAAHSLHRHCQAAWPCLVPLLAVCSCVFTAADCDRHLQRNAAFFNTQAGIALRWGCAVCGVLVKILGYTLAQGFTAVVEDQRLSLYSSALSVQTFRNTRKNKIGGLEAASDLSQGLTSPEVCGKDPVLKVVFQRDSQLKSYKDWCKYMGVLISRFPPGLCNRKAEVKLTFQFQTLGFKHGSQTLSKV